MNVILPPLSDVIRTYGLDAKKSLGQHFLLDGRIVARIAHASGIRPGLSVIEIGPGPGGLTRALLEAGAERVVAVEKDARCLAALEELARAYPGRLELIEGDALALDAAALAPAPRAIVSNLPYNIGTPLLIGWLKDIYERKAYASLTLMFQKEVAERIVAEPDSAHYGRLAVISQFLCDAVWHFDLPPGAFSPPPKVDSAVIGLTPLGEPRYPAKLELLERVTASAFGQRRKMLRGSLKSLGVDVAELLERAGIDGTRRAETLSVEEFCALARGLE